MSKKYTLKYIKNLIGKNRVLLEGKYDVKSIGIFGSFSRNENQGKSDIDLLVDFTRTPDLFQFIRMEKFLRRLLGKKIDLVSKNALKPLIREEILRETIYL